MQKFRLSEKSGYRICSQFQNSIKKKKRNEKGELVITKSFSKSSNFRALYQHS